MTHSQFVQADTAPVRTASSPVYEVGSNRLMEPLSVLFAVTVLLRTSNTLRCACVHAKSLQLCLTLCDAMDCSLPGSSVHGILQARMLEWIAVPFSRGSSQPRDRTSFSCLLHCQADSLPLASPGKPHTLRQQQKRQ